MYCPKCEKTIRRERLEDLSEDLKRRFNIDALDQGVCPVCGTRLIDTGKGDED
ncbi:MAG: hypothetical protein ACLFUV_01390 [Methanomassiliicoccales archaeon]